MTKKDIYSWKNEGVFLRQMVTKKRLVADTGTFGGGKEKTKGVCYKRARFSIQRIEEH